MPHVSKDLSELCDLPELVGIGFHKEQITFDIHTEQIPVDVNRCAPADFTCAPLFLTAFKLNALEQAFVLVALTGIAIDIAVNDDWIRVMRGYDPTTP